MILDSTRFIALGQNPLVWFLFDMSSQDRSQQVMSGHVQLGQFKSGHVKLGQVKSGQVKLGQVKLRQVKSIQVKLEKGQTRMAKNISLCGNLDSLANILPEIA